MSYTNLFSKYTYITTEPNAANEVAGLCPMHHDSRPSLSFNDETGLWWCFSCRKGGDAIQFVEMAAGLPYDEAKRVVDDAIGRPTLPTETDISLWRETLKSATTVQAYLERRGITDPKLVEQYELGFDGERITLPIRDKAGALLNVRRLRVGTEGDKVLNWRGFGRVQLWPMSQLDKSDTVLICAGEIDCLSAIQQGYTAVTGTGGESVWRKDLTPLFLGKTVYVVYDGDDAGRSGAQEVAKHLSGTAKNVFIVNLPDGEDTNSLHQKGVSLKEFIESAGTAGQAGARKVDGVTLLKEAEEEAKRPWLIENLLRPGWLGVLGGHGKGGKTTFVTHMMKCLKQGTPFLNYPTRQCNALYISYEMAVLDLAELYRDVNGTDPTLWPDTLLDPPRPLKPEDLQQFLTLEPGVVVIDSATPAFNLRGDAENQAGEVGYYLRGIQEVARRLGWAVLIIHHTRKSGTGTYLDLAGSREWIAAPDVILTWEKGSSGEPGTLRVEGRVPPVEALSVELTRQSLSLVGSKAELASKQGQSEVVDLLVKTPGLTTQQIAESLDMAPSAIWKILTNGDFVRLGNGKRGDPHVWYHLSRPPKSGETGMP